MARAYWINGPWRGQLAIVPRPRGGDWLTDEVSSWRAVGVDVVVSFLTPDEVIELDLKAEKELCGAHGIRFISFAIPDRGVPSSKDEAAALVHDLEQSLARGDKVALHCRQSVGRSALIAAYLVVDAGADPRSAFERISAARGGKVPDTSEQEQWVADRAAEDRRTKGEKLFETYLRLQGITDYEFEKSHPGKTTKPDYSVTLDREYLFEVKVFEPKDIFGSGAYDPHSRISKKIDKGRKEFREYEGWPCSLVLYNNDASLVHLESPEIMLGAMYRNVGINENTTISALITLRDVEVGPRKLGAFLDRLKEKKPDITPAEALEETFSPDIDFDKHERQMGVIVWENVIADIPFPRNIFCGPYDERYVRDGNKPKRIFAGSEILALEELEKSASLLKNAS